MATVATYPFLPFVNPLYIGLFPPAGRQIAPFAESEPAPEALQTRPQEPVLRGMLAWLAAVPLALLVVPLWPLLFVALPLLIVVLTPFVIGYKVLATLNRVLATHRRGRRAAG